MSYGDFLDYNKVIDAALASENFTKYKEKYEMDPIDATMYLTLACHNTSSRIRKEFHEMQEKKSTPATTCIRISSLILQNIFDQVDYIPKSLFEYNSQFDGFNRFSKNNPNPYKISYSQFVSYLTNKSQDDIEQYLKVMSLSNKASKILYIFRYSNIRESLEIAGRINKKNHRNENPKTYSTYKKDYIQLLNIISSASNEPQENGQPLKTNFLNTYFKYLKKEISKEELKESQAYIDMINLFKEKNTHNCYLNPASIFKHLSLSHTIDSLYLIKNLFFKKALREFSQISKTTKTDKYRVTKCHDTNIEESLSGNCYSTGINFIVKGYNAPFSVHHDPNVIAELEEKYEISLEEGNISAPFISPIPYKYTDLQKAKIRDIHLNSSQSLPPRQTKISNFTTNMLFNIEDLEVKEPQVPGYDLPSKTEVPSDVSDSPSI